MDPEKYERRLREMENKPLSYDDQKHYDRRTEIKTRRGRKINGLHRIRKRRKKRRGKGGRAGRR